MKAPCVEDFSVLIGIDWADQKHDICIVQPGKADPMFSVISSGPKAVHEWAASLKLHYPDKPVAVACELKKGPLIYCLEKYEHIVIFPISPATVAKYRKAFTHSGAKNDPSDALIQTEILARHMDKLSLIEPESPDIRALAQLVEERRKLVQDRVDLSNKITAILKRYYPQPIDWFVEKDSVIFCDFITKWPSLQALQKARKQTLVSFFNQHNSRYPQRNAKRIAEIRSAVALTDDIGIIEPNQLVITLLIQQLKLLVGAVEQLDKAIRTRYKKQNDRNLFDSFPGAGPQLAPRLLVAFGSNRSRYNSASEIQKFAGIAPVTEQSGQKSWTHWRYSCPKFLRQTFVEWAGQSVRFSFWAKAYYQRQIAKGKPHNTVIRSLAFKWIRIAFKCWKTRTPYDESVYLNALKEKKSSLLKYAIES
jgi:transposase